MDAAAEVRKYMAEDTNSSSTNDEEDYCCWGTSVPPGYPSFITAIPHSSSPNGATTPIRQVTEISMCTWKTSVGDDCSTSLLVEGFGAQGFKTVYIFRHD